MQVFVNRNYATTKEKLEMTIKWNRLLLPACLALIGFTMKTASADEWNKEMDLQFNAPVQVPGHVLQPGKYVFRLADSNSDRNIVQIFAVDEAGRENFVTTILTVSDYRMKTPDKPIVEFEERHSGDPEAIKSWFYPGANTGWHFVYPKSERLEVANVAPPPAPAPPPAAEPLPQPPVETAEETPQEAPVVAVEKEVLISEIESIPDPIPDSQAEADRSLPETAGHSAALLLAGVLTAGAGLFALLLSLRRSRIQAEA
ncbi:MAG: hypothetical protein C5B51_24115 [Terriglobia bacterium]|nr:MAG: hypothetical protein C5B51_24115 [Terriglobia bacterium]